MTIYPVPKPERKPKQPKQAFGKGQRAQRSGGHLFEKLVSTGRRAFCRQQRCIVTGVKTGGVVMIQPWMPGSLKAMCPYVARVVVAHVKSRGAGHSDESNIVPLEEQVHTLQGQKGWGWLEKAARLMSVKEIAAELETKFRARQAAIAKRMAAAGERTPVRTEK